MLRFMKAIRKGSPVGILIDLTLKMNDPGVIISSFGLRMRTTCCTRCSTTGPEHGSFHLLP